MIIDNRKKPTLCRGCGAKIVWLRTSHGKNIPVNFETYTDERMFDPRYHISHFSNCPKSKEFRKKKEAQ